MRTQIRTLEDGKKVLDQEIKTGNGHICSVFKDKPIYPLTRTEIQEFGREVGYKNFQFYSNYDKVSFSSNSEELIAVIS